MWIMTPSFAAYCLLLNVSLSKLLTTENYIYGTNTLATRCILTIFYRYCLSTQIVRLNHNRQHGEFPMDTQSQLSRPALLRLQ